MRVNAPKSVSVPGTISTSASITSARARRGRRGGCRGLRSPKLYPLRSISIIPRLPTAAAGLRLCGPLQVTESWREWSKAHPAKGVRVKSPRGSNPHSPPFPVSYNQEVLEYAEIP